MPHALQFPDPHFKARHKKRRVVQPQLVRAITARMPPGGELLFELPGLFN